MRAIKKLVLLFAIGVTDKCSDTAVSLTAVLLLAIIPRQIECSDTFILCNITYLNC